MGALLVYTGIRLALSSDSADDFADGRTMRVVRRAHVAPMMAALLVFVGLKMLVEDFIVLPIVSLGVIVATLGAAVGGSLLFSSKTSAAARRALALEACRGVVRRLSRG